LSLLAIWNILDHFTHRAVTIIGRRGMHNNDPENPALHPTTLALSETASTARPARYVGNEIFRRPAFNGNHPLNIMRHSTVFDLVRTLDWLPGDAFRESSPADEATLLRFHDRDYIEALREADRTGRVTPEVRKRYHIGTMANPLFPNLYLRARTAVGGSILAADLACDGLVAFHPSGGTHHGRPDRASGFCYFNDPVFALLRLIENGKRRVLYVDLDAHHGDGVENAFLEDDRVTTISIHQENCWPYSGNAGDFPGRAVYNLPVPAEFNDSEFRYLLETAVLPFACQLEPDALVLCCGADCLAGDPLSKMRLSNVALWQAVEQFVSLNTPTVILGGGGYNPWTVARYWAGLWGCLNRFDIRQQLPDAAVEILTGLECDLVDDEDIEVAWTTGLADSPNEGSIRDSVKSIAETLSATGVMNDVA